MKTLSIFILTACLIPTLLLGCKTTEAGHSAVRELENASAGTTCQSLNYKVAITFITPTDAEAHYTDVLTGLTIPLGMASRPSGWDAPVNYTWQATNQFGIPFTVEYVGAEQRATYVIEEHRETLVCTPDGGGVPVNEHQARVCTGPNFEVAVTFTTPTSAIAIFRDLLSDFTSELGEATRPAGAEVPVNYGWTGTNQYGYPFEVSYIGADRKVVYLNDGYVEHLTCN